MIDFNVSLYSKIYLLVLVFARMTGILLFTPVIGGRSVPRSVRCCEALLFSLITLPSLWYLAIPAPESVVVGFTAVLGEFLIGVAAGTGLLVFFSALAMTGDMIGRLGGFSVSASLDPSMGEEIPTLAVFLRMAGVAVFLLAGGLDAFVMGALDSFTALSPGSGLFNEAATVTVLTQILTSAVTLALRLAAPVILSAAVLWLTIGLLSRSFPQMNMMTFAFSGNTLLTLAVIHLTLAGTLWVVQAEIPNVLRLIFETLGSPPLFLPT